MAETTKNASANKQDLLNGLVTDVAKASDDDSLRELKAHLKDMEQLFYQRSGEGVNLLEYNRNWWDQYQKRYPELGHEVLTVRQERAENFIYEICTHRDKGITWLFVLMHNVHSVRSEYREICAGDQRWQEYCLEGCNADKAELKYRYITAQKILGKTYPGWKVRDGDYFEEHIWPAVKDEHAKLREEVIKAVEQALRKSRKQSSSQRNADSQQSVEAKPVSGSTEAPLKPDGSQDSNPSGFAKKATKSKARRGWQPSPLVNAQQLSVPTGSSGEEPSYEKITEGLIIRGWLTSDGKLKRKSKDLLSCARYVVDLEWASRGYYWTNDSCIPEMMKLVRKLSKDYNLPTESRLKQFLGGSLDAWLVNAKEWLR